MVRRKRAMKTAMKRHTGGDGLQAVWKERMVKETMIPLDLSVIIHRNVEWCVPRTPLFEP